MEYFRIEEYLLCKQEGSVAKKIVLSSSCIHADKCQNSLEYSWMKMSN